GEEYGNRDRIGDLRTQGRRGAVDASRSNTSSGGSLYKPTLGRRLDVVTSSWSRINCVSWKADSPPVLPQQGVPGGLQPPKQNIDALVRALCELLHAFSTSFVT